MEDQKWSVMKSEMDRFEAEISSLGSGPVLGGNIGSSSKSALFIPASVVRRTATPAVPPAPSAGPVIISGAPQVYKSGPVGPVLSKGPSPAFSSSSYSTTISAPPTSASIQVQMRRHVRPSLIPGAPQITTAVGTAPRLIPINLSSESASSDIKARISSLESTHDAASTSSIQKSSTSSDAVAGSSGSPTKGKKKKKKGDDSAASPEKKPRKHVRAAGGTVWEDPTLLDWDTNDFRLFCGDLGNDVTDEVLARVFGRYASFQKAKVVRDKRTNKTKGYGFVSFKDPNDFVRAIRELDGRYVGSRPIKLRKSTWKARSLNQVRKREKEFKQLMGPKKPKF